MQMPPENKIFSYTLTVLPEHLDEMQHVNNVVYVGLMQDVANKHWDSIPLTEAEREVMWVVRRHEIDYLNQAFLHDCLQISTWTGEHSTVSWTRHCEIVRIADQKKIITSKSVWVLLDKQSGKPKRIDEKILNRFG